ncbi:MAG: hypothetical protein ACXVMS_06450 [Flavisolibacter sp.]
MADRKPDEKRGMVAFVFVIILGYIIGIFIRRVQVGLIIGLALGLLGSSLLRRR